MDSAAGVGTSSPRCGAPDRPSLDPYLAVPGADADLRGDQQPAQPPRATRPRAAGAGPGRRPRGIVELTPAGKRLVDRVIAEHLENERRLIAGLSRAEQQELAALLRKLLLTLEPEEQARPDRRAAQ